MKVASCRDSVAVLIMLDSTTAVSKFMSVQVSGPIDHACAKEKRFLGWMDKILFTCGTGCGSSGGLVAHMISRIFYLGAQASCKNALMNVKASGICLL